MFYIENLPLLIVFLAFTLATVIQLIYYYFIYLKVYRYESSENDNHKPPVSIIICARNESENLKNFLTSVLEQDYPDYEVIVVNDCSEDNTDEILRSYLKKYSNLRVSTITKDPKFTHNKKFAQFIGIKAAKNEILLFTDADCYPETDKWIANMVRHFDDNTSFVLGFGGYEKRKGLLNRYIRYDSMIIAMQYLGLALSGRPYMGVGRNLAYRKSLFFKNRGYGNFNHIISGDDDLFVNTNATEENTRVEYGKESHTLSIPCSTMKEWKKQKRRHLTTAPYYKSGDKFILLTETFSRAVFYILFIILLCFLYQWPYVLGIFGLKIITEIIVFSLVQKKLNEHGLLFFSLFFDIFSLIINGMIFPINAKRSSSKNKWR
jgi:poly-beta-1,6-N-acetyl-D-glucosamine synthase